MVGGMLDEALNSATTHRLGEEKWLSLTLAPVEEGDDVLVAAEAAHRLRLALDALAARFVRLRS
ncbi:MAG TPA: hypothetical protein VFA70_13480 [Dehalococcoidia bacterium]|nr:hypothetical protein [Dehalococcoidia bacterium]